MSQRKLQQDIDKVLKKVKDGVSEFNTIYEKFESIDSNDNQSYKEKLEMDLKREVKKLQKHREQIKLWVSKEDIKDKDQLNNLLASRKTIENKMEIFKSIEKLMKIKQFSKVALSNPNLLVDPNDKEKNESCQFVADCINELQKQLELLETDQLDSDDESSNGNNSDDNDESESIERHEYHINNLENILKLIQNDEMSSSKLNEFKDDILYYVENNSDPDFVEYDTLYQDMGCEVTTSTTIPIKPIQPSVSEKKKSTASPKKKAAAAASVAAKANVQDSPSNKKESSPSRNNSNKNDSEEDKQEPTLPFPKDRTEEINEVMAKDIETNKAFQNDIFKDELKYWHNSKRQLLQPYNEMPQDVITKLESSLLNCPDSLDADSPYLYKKPLSLPHPTSIFFPNEPIRFIYPYDINEHNQNANDKNNANNNNNNNNNSNNSNTPNSNNNQINNPTEHTSNSNTPASATISINGTTTSTQGQNRDLTKQYYNDIYSNTSLAKIFTKFDLDTLFFIFYHYQGSYEQFLSARELNKNRNWLFNKKDRCWYYKEIEKLPPGIISNSNTDVNKLEEESWRYFDYKKSWLARRCNPDFIYNESDFEVL
ncbi:general negative regulator of transcription subunit 5 [Monosporozyma unispora]|nr:general negative regulator of transcription subunit 5 [Kazachstania unispora]